MRYNLFIGRYQSPHKGHMYIFDTFLKEDKPVLIAIRDIEPDAANPLPAAEVKMLWEKVYAGNPLVKVIIPVVELNVKPVMPTAVLTAVIVKAAPSISVSLSSSKLAEIVTAELFETMMRSAVTIGASLSAITVIATASVSLNEPPVPVLPLSLVAIVSVSLPL